MNSDTLFLSHRFSERKKAFLISMSVYFSRISIDFLRFVEMEHSTKSPEFRLPHLTLLSGLNSTIKYVFNQSVNVLSKQVLINDELCHSLLK